MTTVPYVLDSTVGILVLAIGTLLAAIGYLLNEVDHAQERSLEAAVDREMRDALHDPLTSLGGGEGAVRSAFGAHFIPEDFGPYPYRDLPDPMAPPARTPAWLVEALDRSDTWHTLDRDDTLVAFLRVSNADGLVDCPVHWACQPAPDGRGVAVQLIFEAAAAPHEAVLRFAFERKHDLRHAVSLARQDVLRLDILEEDDRGRLHYAGCREAPVPPGVTAQVRQTLLDFGDQVGRG